MRSSDSPARSGGSDDCSTGGKGIEKKDSPEPGPAKARRGAARAARSFEPAAREAYLEGELCNVTDFCGFVRRDRPAEPGNFLGKGVADPSVRAAVPRHDA